MDFGHLEVKNALKTAVTNLPVLLWSKGVEIRGDFSDPFDSSSGCETGVWSWLLKAIFGVNGVKVVGVGGGLETDSV